MPNIKIKPLASNNLPTLIIAAALWAAAVPGAWPLDVNHNGDWDADGLMDPSIYCEATGEWRALLVSTDYTPVWLYWGGPGWSAIQSDYDGDRMGDYAVTWPDTSEWRSSRGWERDHCVDDWRATGFRPVQR